MKRRNSAGALRASVDTISPEGVDTVITLSAEEVCPVQLMLCLPLEKLDRLALQERLSGIGKM